MNTNRYANGHYNNNNKMSKYNSNNNKNSNGNNISKIKTSLHTS
jgi:hypothetical protein